MKLRINRWKRLGFPLLLIFVSSLLLSCAKKVENKNVVVRIALPDENGDYKFQNVKLKSISNVEEVRGAVADIYLDADGVKEHIKKDAHIDGQYRFYKLNGQRPKLNLYRDSKGVYHPKDYIGYEALSVYANIERLEDLNKKIGIPDLLRLPRQINLSQIDIMTDGLSEDNAYYHTEYDYMAFIPYSGSALSTSINAGVVGHEYFHAIFNYLKHKNYKPKLVLEDFFDSTYLENTGVNIPANLHARTSAVPWKHSVVIPTAYSSSCQVIYELKANMRSAFRTFQYNEYFIQDALNEGMADVWAWIYTNNSNFFGHTFNSLAHQTARSLDAKHSSSLDVKTSLVQESIVEAADIFSKKSGFCLGYYARVRYPFGTRFARTMKAILNELYVGKNIDKHPKEVRTKMAKHVIKFIERFFQNYNVKTKIHPDRVLDMMVESQTNSKAVCLLINKSKTKVSKYKKDCDNLSSESVKASKKGS